MKLKKKPLQKREFNSLSDFFLNASPERQEQLFIKAGKMANAEQRKLVEKAKKLRAISE